MVLIKNNTLSYLEKHFSILMLMGFMLTFAQKETSNWYFKDQRGISFNSGVPVVLQNGRLTNEEGCSSISSASGQLLFYTDGATVYNRNHDMMQNGAGLAGSPDSATSSIIFPDPGDPNKYYIFTMSGGGSAMGLNYSKVDMTLDSGLGAVTVQNIRLDPMYAAAHKLTAVRHTDGQQLWVISHRSDSNAFTAFLVSATGVISTPVVSTIGENLPSIPIGFPAAVGYLKVSPNGKKIATVKNYPVPTVELFDFDTATGQLSSGMLLESAGGGYGVEFSADSKRMYYTDCLYNGPIPGIFQYDMTLTGMPAIVNSRKLIKRGSYMALQLAPDGKIYAIQLEDSGAPKKLLSIIHSPENLGAECHFQDTGINMGAYTGFGLPSFMQSFLRQDIVIQQGCPGNPTLFSVDLDNVASAVWNFGDGATSTQINAEHYYSSPGKYTVTVDVIRAGTTAIVHMEKTTVIYADPVAHKPEDMLLCVTQSTPASTFDLESQTAVVLAGQSADDFGVTYYTTADDVTTSSPITTITHSMAIQTIIAKVTRFSTGCYALTEFDTGRLFTPVVQGKKDLKACRTGNGNTAVFDLTENTPLILGTQDPDDFEVMYYTSAEAADAGLAGTAITLPTAYTSESTTLYARIDHQLLPECHVITPISLLVNEPPVLGTAGSIPDIVYCEPLRTGYHSFVLSDYYGQLLPGKNASLYTIRFYRDQAAVDSGQALPDNYTNTVPFIQTVIVIVRDNSTGCSSQSTARLIVDQLPIANSVTANFTECDYEGSNDGIITIDISGAGIEALGSQNPANHIVTFYRSLADAEVGRNAIADPTVYQNENPDLDRVWISVATVHGCTSFTSFEVAVERLPVPVIKDGSICMDFKTGVVLRTALLSTMLDSTHSFAWYKDGILIDAAVSSTYETSEAGNYTVVATSSSGCRSAVQQPAVVSVSGPAVAIGNGYTISDTFSDEQALTIHVEGYGEYLYQADGNPWQQSNVFTNLTAGIHTVHVKDVSSPDACDGKGFDLYIKNIMVMGYPKFFTPNGDTYNDTWNIPTLAGQPDAVIYIFDRYGKQLKQLLPAGPGWDGTLNGNELPATDYWFVVTFKEERQGIMVQTEFRSHFALKR